MKTTFVGLVILFLVSVASAQTPPALPPVPNPIPAGDPTRPAVDLNSIADSMGASTSAPECSHRSYIAKLAMTDRLKGVPLSQVSSVLLSDRDGDQVQAAYAVPAASLPTGGSTPEENAIHYQAIISLNCMTAAGLAKKNAYYEPK